MKVIIPPLICAERPVSFLLSGESRKIGLIDLMTGEKYRLPDAMLKSAYQDCAAYQQTVMLQNLPLTDSPLLLTFGEFDSEA